MKATAVALGVVAFLVFVFFVPWATWASFQALTNGDGTFTVGDWFAAAWFLLLFGGAGAAANR